MNAVSGLEDDAPLLPTFRKHRAAWDRWVDLVDLDVERFPIPYEGTTLPGASSAPRASTRGTRTRRRRGERLGRLAAGAVVGRRVRGGAPRVPRARVRRPGPAVGALRARGPVPSRLRGGPHARARRGRRAGRRRPRPRRALQDQPGRLLGHARARVRAPPGRGRRRPRGGRRGHLVGARGAEEPPQAPGQGRRPRVRPRHGARPAPVEGRRPHVALPRAPVRRRGVRRDAARGPPVRRLRRRRAGHDAAARHEPGGRAVLARPAGAAGRARPGATLVTFSDDEGASGHCEPLGRALVEQRVLDWLDERLAR